MEIPFVKRFSESPNFYSYAVDVNCNERGYNMDLMAMSNWDEEFNGCRNWWVVGHLPGFIMYETKLKRWGDIVAAHKPNCWLRKYSGCSDILGIERDDKVKMKILKELGWKRDDTFGIAATCDCGWDESRKQK